MQRGRHLLREWLDRSRLNQKQFAADLGVSRPYVCTILSGERRPKLELLVRIEDLTGVPVESWVVPAKSDLGNESVPTAK